MAYAKINKTSIVVYYIDSVWGSLPQFRDREIMAGYPAGILSLTLFRPVIFEAANIFLLLCVDRYHRIPVCEVSVGCPVYKRKLLIAVRAWNAKLLHFLIDLPAVSHFAQQLRYLHVTDGHQDFCARISLIFRRLNVETTQCNSLHGSP